MHNYIDLTGKTFGRLFVICRTKQNEPGKPLFLCQCDCGNKKIVPGVYLRNKTTSSCGCLGKERRIEANVKHRMIHTPEYKSWASMKDRCNNPNNKRYKFYKGKGITYCKEWESFTNFIKDMGIKPSHKSSIERIDNNGMYEPNNCKWGSPLEQSRNRSSIVLLTYKNETKCVSEWAEITGINAKALYARIKRGWCVEKILHTPIRKFNSTIVISLSAIL